MAQPYLGEIRCFGFNFAPRQWAQCSGQILPISQNTALFSLLGTNFGGNGQTTFGLPNLQGQIPMHWGSGAGLSPTDIGEVQGEAQVTLITQNLPAHTHTAIAATIKSGEGAERSPTPNSASFLSEAVAPDQVYNKTPSSFTQTFSPKAISPNGNGQPHPNMQPYLVLNFCIALSGVFPQRS